MTVRSGLLVLLLCICALTGGHVQAQAQSPAERWDDLAKSIVPIAQIASAVVLFLGIIVSIVTHKGTLKQQRDLQRTALEEQSRLQKQNFEMQRQFKKVDAFIYCQNRYHNLMWSVRRELKELADRLDGEPKPGEAGSLYWQNKHDVGKEFWLRFWTVQYEQYYFHELGYIPEDLFRMWMKHRFGEYHKRDVIKFLGVTWEEGWTYARSMLEDKLFIQHMEEVFNADLDTRRARARQEA